jgi:hypothetical protein
MMTMVPNCTRYEKSYEILVSPLSLFNAQQARFYIRLNFSDTSGNHNDYLRYLFQKL